MIVIWKNFFLLNHVVGGVVFGPDSPFPGACPGGVSISPATSAGSPATGAIPTLRRLVHVALIAVAAGLTTGATASAEGTTPLATVEVAPGLFVHQGRHLPVEDHGHGDIANIGFIVGERCVAVVDTGGAPATGAALLASVRAHTDLPVCHVINTHVHFDHVLGNAAFRKEPGVSFVGHRNLAAGLAASAELFRRRFGAGEVVSPDVQVTDRLTLDLGRRELELQVHGLAHTDSDLTVFDRGTGTLWTGDLVVLERIPALDGSVNGWIAELDALQEAPAQRIVPGHGPAAAAWPDAAAPTRTYLVTLRDAVRAGIAAGAFMEDLMSSAAEEEKRRWLLHEFHHARNVARAFTELEWE